MNRSAKVLLLIGLLIAVLGTLQFLLVLALSSDPNPNPVGNGILMWLAWAVGGIIAGLGLFMAIFGAGGGRSTPA